MTRTKPENEAPASLVPVTIRAGAGARVAATLRAAAAAGLTAGRKGKRVSGRAHERLFEAAASRSGLEGSELIEYALAKVALEDDFAAKLLAREGKVGRDVDIEF